MSLRKILVRGSKQATIAEAHRFGLTPKFCQTKKTPRGPITTCQVSCNQNGHIERWLRDRSGSLIFAGLCRVSGTRSIAGYETAPATKLLATHCAVCARPLVDAESVESGIGPICAEKHGGRIACDPAVRAEANKLIYEIARYQKGPEVDAAVKRLHELGFDILAKRISKRLAKRVFANPTIVDTGKFYVFTFRYSPQLVEAIKRVPGKSWAKDLGGWVIPYRSKREFFEFLKRNFAGQVIDGPKGPFTP